MKTGFIRAGIVLVIASAFTWQSIGAWQDSQTTDEAVHLSAGRSYWQTGDYRLNPEHPALFKLWAALPLVLTPEAQLQTDTPIWRSGNQWTIGAEYLYTSPAQARYGSHWLLWLGRLPMIVIWLGLVVTLAVWSWRRWGPWPALAVTAVIAYDPNFLGHGHLVTNDVATSFAYLGTWLILWRFINRPSWSTLGWFSLVFAAAQLTKYSAVILWLLVPFVLALARWYRRPGLTWRWWWRALLALVVVTSVATWTVYGWRVNRIDRDPRITQLWQERQDLVSRDAVDTVPPLIQKFIAWSDPATATGRMFERVQRFSIPGYWYWRGFFSTTSHNYYGHAAYLLGQASTAGWWYYFPVALFVKTPILLLVSVLSLVIINAKRFYRRLRQRAWSRLVPFDFWMLGFPPLIFLGWSMTSHINIGVRHVFPAYVFWPLAVGSLLAVIGRRWPRVRSAVAVTVAVLTVSVATLAWPHTIGYYNGLIGGTAQGHRYVLDSNLDWNQDIWRLRRFLDTQRFPEVHLALFGSIPTETIFPERLNVLGDQEVAAGVRPTGVVVISAGQLYNLDGPFSWLRPLTPRWRIGSSINVYDFR
ncbi:MAG: hypothetical protein AAB619_02115 [Patescibacteria group bacterium]